MSPEDRDDDDDLPRTLTATDGAPQALPSLRLVVLAGSDLGRELKLARGTYVVGKGRGCDLVLGDRHVSRRHLALTVDDRGVCARDLDSKNGSWLDKARFVEVTLAPGAVVRVGSTELKLLSVPHLPHLWPSPSSSFGKLVGRSLAMRELFAVLEQASPSDTTVFIQGETGTGKEVCAESIHAASSRAARPFVVCDLASVQPGLIESELFGHRRGAFTGAAQDREGLIVSADGGTLFLDEVAELGLDQQPRLLRLLERKQVKPVGAATWRTVDVRVVAATNRDLARECRAGRFREDLYHRLMVLRVRIPPLRERKEDLPLLVEHLLAGRRMRVPPETIALFAEHDWPGNVRELRNVLERALSFAGDRGVLAPELVGLEVADDGDFGEEQFHLAKDRLVAEWERSYLKSLLVRCQGNVARAARRSGLGRTYLHRLLRKHGLAAR
jgi:DNA-binding NtrC family response regulator